MFELPIYNKEGEEIEKINLPRDIFDGKVNVELVTRVLLAYQHNKRRPVSCTKTRSAVCGSGRKPWRQKGTGRARIGSVRSPLWRHGGVAFGPKVRSYYVNLPKRVLRQGLRYSLNDKLNAGAILILNDLDLGEIKTKAAKRVFTNLGVEGDILVVLDKIDEIAIKSIRNIKGVEIRLADNLNSDDLVRHKKIVLLKSAIDRLIQRLNKKIRVENEE